MSIEQIEREILDGKPFSWLQHNSSDAIIDLQAGEEELFQRLKFHFKQPNSRQNYQGNRNRLNR